MEQRKQIRLPNYDYSQNNVYFVTICTQNREMLFGDVGADSISARLVTEIFLETLKAYPYVDCPKFVLMPNHMHALIAIHRPQICAEDDSIRVLRNERAEMDSAPTLSAVIQTFKRRSTLAYIRLVKEGALPPFDRRIWQRSYYDHIVRGEKEYQQIWRYIDENPLKWELDQLYEPK